MNNKVNMSTEEIDVEHHDKIKPLISSWKMISIITAYINRNIMAKSDLTTNITVVDKKPVLIRVAAEPVLLNLNYVDTYNINLFREVHRSLILICDICDQLLWMNH